MPEPTHATITVSSSTITHAIDPARLAPFSYPTAVTVAATLHFADGSSQDFTHDHRALITVRFLLLSFLIPRWPKNLRVSKTSPPPPIAPQSPQNPFLAHSTLKRTHSVRAPTLFLCCR